MSHRQTQVYLVRSETSRSSDQVAAGLCSMEAAAQQFRSQVKRKQLLLLVFLLFVLIISNKTEREQVAAVRCSKEGLPAVPHQVIRRHSNNFFFRTSGGFALLHGGSRPAVPQPGNKTPLLSFVRASASVSFSYRQCHYYRRCIMC